MCCRLFGAKPSSGSMLIIVINTIRDKLQWVNSPIITWYRVVIVWNKQIQLFEMFQKLQYNWSLHSHIISSNHIWCIFWLYLRIIAAFWCFGLILGSLNDGNIIILEVIFCLSLLAIHWGLPLACITTAIWHCCKSIMRRQHSFHLKAAFPLVGKLEG